MDKEKYLLAKANGLEEQFRGDEIANEIRKFIPPNDQQALQTHMINDLINNLPLSHLDEWNKYQAARIAAIAKVDGEIEEIEKNLKEAMGDWYENI